MKNNKISFISEKTFKNRFKELYDIAKKNCLFNISEDTTLDQFQHYPQVINRGEFIQNLFSNDEFIYNNDWIKRVLEPLEKLLNRKIYCSVGAFHLSFTCYILLDEFNTDSTKYSLNFTISFMTNLFSIEIIEAKKTKDLDYDFFKDKIKGYDEYYFKTNKVYVSPIDPFSEIFNQVECFIRQKFPKYKFLPSYFDLIKVDGLSANNDLRPNVTISKSLLGQMRIMEDEFSNRLLSVIGDIYYGDKF